eukprot:TRINITY_DN21549_c0_g1_i1.p1 TRINITY_DN21549_c0_g1~~TRINITY_DN21549_c0_g1_i1.p1  ORF type:complete len:643 (-),score=111.84 TRINITY_DN21549_c0_g1_i1:444-2372(-)
MFCSPQTSNQVKTAAMFHRLDADLLMQSRLSASDIGEAPPSTRLRTPTSLSGTGGGGLFEDPRAQCGALAQQGFAMLDLWRVNLDQCPECGRVHGHGAGGALRPDRHIFVYVEAAAEELMCPLCGEALQNPQLAPCGHHHCLPCVRYLLTRSAGRAACPLDGQALTRFATRPPQPELVAKLDQLRIECPVCGETIRKADLELHLQDPVHMVEDPNAYGRILRPFYMSCPLSNFTIGEFNGSSALIRLYKDLGEKVLRKFVWTSNEFIVLPDPKMGFQPSTTEDAEDISNEGGYFNAWWVHPAFRSNCWWNQDSKSESDSSGILEGYDCSTEPWAASSFCHTWSQIQKPNDPAYLCTLRDLRGEHVPSLLAFRQGVRDFIRESFGATDVDIFCHYPSSARYSTLHFHIIFGHRFRAYAQKLERPHQLSRQFDLNQVIENLQKDGMYYAQREFRYYLGDKADLMDPMSAYYGASPHRHVAGYTFTWDVGAIPRANRQPGASSKRADDQDTLLRLPPSASPGRSSPSGRDELLSQEVRDLRQRMEDMREAIRSIQAALASQAAAALSKSPSAPPSPDPPVSARLKNDVHLSSSAASSPLPLKADPWGSCRSWGWGWVLALTALPWAVIGTSAAAATAARIMYNKR